jgi:GNAT superfamily N-acetyltransferase
MTAPATKESMPAGVRIRPASRRDAAALAELMGELGYPTRPAEMEMRLDAMNNEPRYSALVAVIDDEICGMIGTSWTHSYAHNDPGGAIIALVVAGARRGRGVGGALIKAAEKDFIARNITRISINTRFEREEAHRFYEGRGYIRNGYRLVKELGPAEE